MDKQIIIEVGQIVSIYDCNKHLISKIKCVKDNKLSCHKCIFDKTTACNSIECFKMHRPDGLNVHFEYVKP